MNEGRSTLATVALGLAVLAVVAVVAGPLAIHAGIVTPFRGFRIFGFGLLASLPILVLSLAALVRTRGPTQREGRRSAARATGVSVALALLFAALAAPAMRVPQIHDITTDPEDPPQFVEAERAPENQGGVLAYPRETVAQQRVAYPDVAPIVLKAAPGDAYAAALRAASNLGWQVVRSDPSGGTLEATSTSRLFLFVDDVTVRVRPQDQGSRIDLRSRSRVGKSDLGANAARIRAFAAELDPGAR
jgi:uncharacterized protein (DUF1499 family)